MLVKISYIKMKLILITTALMLSNCAPQEPSVATRIKNSIGSYDNGVLCQRPDESDDKACYRVEKETGPVIVGDKNVAVKKDEKPVLATKKVVKKSNKPKKSLAEMCISNGFKKEAKK